MPREGVCAAVAALCDRDESRKQQVFAIPTTLLALHIFAQRRAYACAGSAAAAALGQPPGDRVRLLPLRGGRLLAHPHPALLHLLEELLLDLVRL